jgi:transcriptional activator SPT8
MFSEDPDDEDDHQLDDDDNNDIGVDLESALKETDDEASEIADNSTSEDSESSDSDSDDEEQDNDTSNDADLGEAVSGSAEDDGTLGLEATLEMDLDRVLSEPSTTRQASLQPEFKVIPTPPLKRKSPSPAELRRKGLVFSPPKVPRSFVVEAIAALPHPVPTHALAASHCMTHLITGSDDGYIRDYDLFPAVNGKNFLTAPQRHYSGIVEGILKTVQIRSWWENLSRTRVDGLSVNEEVGPLPVYSLAMQSDALWSLAGTNRGTINLCTVRHEPGRLAHVFNSGHRGQPISSLCLDYDETAFFSGGWDGDAILWDLNTGQLIRNFFSHGAQLAIVSIRPENAIHPPQEGMKSPDLVPITDQTDQPPPIKTEHIDSETKSDASDYDPLFDDEPEPSGQSRARPQAASRPIAPPKNAPPLLDHSLYSTFLPDMIMTAYIDGQIVLWDRRAQTPGTGVGRLWMSEKTPPWCLSACWSADGNQIYAGRRNGTIDVWDVRQYGSSSQSTRFLNTLKNPGSSGVVSCVAAFPDGHHIASASFDNIRLWNVTDAAETDGTWKSKSGLQFKIIPGHHGGYVSQMRSYLHYLCFRVRN